MATAVMRRDARGLRITRAVHHFEAPPRFRAAGAGGVVHVHVALRGAYDVTYPALERSFDGLGRHVSIFYAVPFELELRGGTSCVETFGLQVPANDFIEWMDGASVAVGRFCERVARGESSFLLEPAALPTRSEATIQRMLASRYTGALDELYLYSQAIELTVAAVDQVQPEAETNGARDRGKLLEARDLIDARLADPLALRDVARLVGLNEYKLKRGFKKELGTTVFGYIAHQRIALARRLLLDTTKTAAEIAFELGFASPQHFGQTFKKHVGTTPAVFRRNPSRAMG